MKDNSIVMSVNCAASYLGISPSKMRQLMKKYESKFVVSIDGRRMVHRTLLDKWLMANIMK